MIQRVKGSAWRSQDNLNLVNIADLGAQNTDVTTAVSAALAGGYDLLVTPGTWLISTITPPAGRMIQGLGANCILKQKDASNSVMISPSAGCVLSNFAINGNKANQTGTGKHSIYITGVSKVSVRNLYISNSKGSGIAVAGAASAIIIADNEITGHVESGIRVYQGTDLRISGNEVYTPDASSTVPGIYIGSDGNAITNVSLIGNISRNGTDRGLALIGSGSKNVTNVTVIGHTSLSNTSHGIHLSNVQAASFSGGIAASNGADGLRLEGDVDSCRFAELITRSNTSYGAREVSSGGTPNNNGFIYLVNSANGNNTTTIVGGASYVKTS